MRAQILTGDPCCGKTSVIQELQKRGLIVSGEVARKVHEFLKKTYLGLGYTLIYVPLMPVEKRADYILSKLEDRNSKAELKANFPTHVETK